MMLKTKYCPQCKCDKSISEFYSNRARPDGLHAYCKPCNSLRCVARERGRTIEQAEARRVEKAALTRVCKWCKVEKARSVFRGGKHSWCCRECWRIRWRAKKHGMTYEQAAEVIADERRLKSAGLMRCTRCAAEHHYKNFVGGNPNRRAGICRACRSWKNLTSGQRRRRVLSTSQYMVTRERNDLDYRVKRRIAAQVRGALRTQGRTKGGRTFAMLGYSPADLIAHIEAQFEPWMTWDNWGVGQGTWQIDHIRPVATFDLRDANQVKLCWALDNLRPLCSIENSERAAPLRLASRLGKLVRS